MGPFRRFYLKGPLCFYVGAYLFLIMLAPPIKMVLRWLFNLNVFYIQEIFFKHMRPPVRDPPAAEDQRSDR